MAMMCSDSWLFVWLFPTDDVIHCVRYSTRVEPGGGGGGGGGNIRRKPAAAVATPQTLKHSGDVLHAWRESSPLSLEGSGSTSLTANMGFIKYE